MQYSFSMTISKTISLLSGVEEGENITEYMVKEGWVSVRREAVRGESKLAELEDQAKAQKLVSLIQDILCLYLSQNEDLWLQIKVIIFNFKFQISIIKVNTQQSNAQ